MIHIQKNQANTVILTLKEKATISNPTYVLQFLSDETKVMVGCVLSELSVYTDRYNKFTVIEKASPNIQAGEIELNEGLYIYVVREVELGEGDIADPESTSGNIVEKGFCKVSGAVASVPKYEPQSIQNIVYNG